jgi:hypothetical protein
VAWMVEEARRDECSRTKDGDKAWKYGQDPTTGGTYISIHVTIVQVRHKTRVS